MNTLNKLQQYAKHSHNTSHCIQIDPKLTKFQVTKIGGTNKANRMIKIANQRERLEEQFLKQAKQAKQDENDNANQMRNAKRKADNKAYRLEKKRLKALTIQ